MSRPDQTLNLKRAAAAKRVVRTATRINPPLSSRDCRQSSHLFSSSSFSLLLSHLFSHLNPPPARFVFLCVCCLPFRFDLFLALSLFTGGINYVRSLSPLPIILSLSLFCSCFFLFFWVSKIFVNRIHYFRLSLSIFLYSIHTQKNHDLSFCLTPLCLLLCSRLDPFALCVD